MVSVTRPRTTVTRLAVVIAASAWLSACGGTGALKPAEHSQSSTAAQGSGAAGQSAPPPGQGAKPGGGPQVLPAPTPTGVPAPSAAVAVIRGWSHTLGTGDVIGAARYFALPSVLIDGAGAGGVAVGVTIHTLREAILANTQLPCGAQFISADQRGRFVNALFRLTDRPGPGGGGGCGAGLGQTARTNFVITGGRIVHWIRAPDDPGDNGHGTPVTPSGSPNAPAI